MVMDPAELDGHLVRDMTEILTTLRARLYGRTAADGAERAVAVVTWGAW
jgi:predicted site-specific integrase-resolvase